MLSAMIASVNAVRDLKGGKFSGKYPKKGFIASAVGMKYRKTFSVEITRMQGRETATFFLSDRVVRALVKDQGVSE